MTTALGTYLAVPGHCNHLHQSNNAPAAYLATRITESHQITPARCHYITAK